MATRTQIENLGHCSWFNQICPQCNSIAEAFQGVSVPSPLLPSDYAMLCSNSSCPRYEEVGGMVDTDEVLELDDFVPLSALPDL